MGVITVPRSRAASATISALIKRVADREHENDSGPARHWCSEDYFPKLYAAIDSSSDAAFGILYAGGPLGCIDAAWWIDKRFRGEGLGSKMIDAFAAHLKENGVTGVGAIVIDTFRGEYHDASASLARRLKSHFQ